LGLELAERLSVDIDILVNRKRYCGRPGTCNLEQIEKNYSSTRRIQAAKQQLAAIQNKLEQARAAAPSL